jgi:hypothetical protein
MKNLTLKIGEICLKIETREEEFLAQIKARYKKFLTREFPHFEILLMGRRQIKENSRVKGVNVKYNSSKIVIKREHLRAECDLKKKKGILEQTFLIQNFDAFLRIFLSVVLATKKGFLLHASSLIREKKGFVFVGKSSAGKSTIVKLSSGTILLSEEISLIRKIGRKFFLFGTPFFGELGKGGENKKILLDQIFLIKKAKKNHLKKIPLKSALPLLLANVLFFCQSPKLNQQLFKTILEFMEKYPLQKLSFKKDNSFWQVIENAE